MREKDDSKKKRRKKKTRKGGRPSDRAGPEGESRHHAGGEDFDPLAHGKEYRDNGQEPFDPHVASDKTEG
jgi:hypothetical protein